MNRAYPFGAILVAALALVHTVALAEFQCAPAGSASAFPEEDRLFASEVTAWSEITEDRYIEKNCSDVTVASYEGFPTKRCAYENADDGKGVFPALQAEVIVLNPSARQLAAWSIHACRVNGANDRVLSACLEKLRKLIQVSNGAQFPVVGSVVESRCNSSSQYVSCKGLDRHDDARKPRNTWFRDGISVDYLDAQGVKWDGQAYPRSSFDAVFDVRNSDRNIKTTYNVARIAAAYRDHWIKWRKHIGKPQMLDGRTGTVMGGGWRVVAADVQRAACRGVSNELFDAVVWNNPSWTKR